MLTHSVSPHSANRVDEWRVAAEEAARWAKQASDLVKQMDPHLSATESAEQSRIAADLALSANEATGIRASKLKRSAADAAQKAARLAQVVIDHLNQSGSGKHADQILKWSKAKKIADQLVTLSATKPISAPEKRWWELWR